MPITITHAAHFRLLIQLLIIRRYYMRARQDARAAMLFHALAQFISRRIRYA